MPGGVLPPTSNPVPGQPTGPDVASPYELATAAIKAGFPLAEIPTAVAVALAESRGKINAINTANRNGTIDHGAWQINDVNIPTVGYSAGELQTSLQDNANAAYKVWKTAGGSWTPWSTYNDGAYKTWLSVGKSAAGTQAQVKAASNDPVTGAIGGAVSGVESAITSPIAAFTSIFGLFGKQSFWKGIGLVLAGVLVLIFAAIEFKNLAG